MEPSEIEVVDDEVGEEGLEVEVCIAKINNDRVFSSTR